MKKRLLLIMIMGFLGVLFAQEEQPMVKVKTSGGSVFIGRIMSKSDSTVVIKTPEQLMVEVPLSQVVKLDTLGMEKKGTSYYSFTDPNHTRLLYTPTGRTLEKGKGYFSAYMIFFPSFGIALTDFITLMGGVSIFPGASEQLFYVGGKVRVLKQELLHLSLGGMYMNATGMSYSGLKVAFGSATYGTSDRAVTLGLGWGSVDEKVSAQPIVVLGGELRVSENLKLITENWMPPSSDSVLLSLGLRILGRQLAADLGFLYPTGSDTSGFPFIPWMSFTYNFAW